MNPTPLISVITVTYNAGEVIEKTMTSLRKQTFSNFEHLIIDGNSKDNTLKTIEENKVPQTAVISEPDKGLYDAMNKGIRLAKGRYVLFLNAGDVFHSADTLSLYAEKAGEGKDIIYGDTIIVDKKGNKISDRHLSVPEVLTRESFSDGMLICHQAFMVKKDLAPFYDTAYRFSADYDWTIKCISSTKAEDCSNLQTVTIDFLSDGLTDKNKWKSLRERFRIMTIHYGISKTILKHLSFIIRAMRRGRI